MITREAFRQAARSLRGCTFQHMGRTRDSGLDCVGVPYAAAVLAGLSLPATPTYSCQPTGQDLLNGLAQFCDRVADPADADVWQVPFVGGARHVVVPVEELPNGTLCIHAWSNRNRVVETVWRRETAQGWRMRGVEWQAQQ